MGQSKDNQTITPSYYVEDSQILMLLQKMFDPDIQWLSAVAPSHESSHLV